MQGQWSKFSSGVKPTKIAQSQWDKAEAFRAKLNKDLIDLENSLQVGHPLFVLSRIVVFILIHTSLAGVHDPCYMGGGGGPKAAIAMFRRP